MSGEQAPKEMRLPAALPGKALDFSRVVVKRKNWNDPEITLAWDSYTGTINVLGTRLVGQVGQVTAGTSKADGVNVADKDDGTGDLNAVPTLESGPSTLPLKWIDQGTRIRIDFSRLFMLRRFPIPEGTNAHIPLTMAASGQWLEIDFSRAQFEAQESRPRKNPPANQL